MKIKIPAIYRRKKGFTLVEILVIIGIIGLIAAIAIPMLISYRISANENAALANLRMLHGVLATYAVANNGLYPTYFGINTSPRSELWTANPRYLRDPSFGTSPAGNFAVYGGGVKQNYRYWYEPASAPPVREYRLTADPSNVIGNGVNNTVWRYRGRRSFRVTSNGQIQWVWYVNGWGNPQPLQ